MYLKPKHVLFCSIATNHLFSSHVRRRDVSKRLRLTDVDRGSLKTREPEMKVLFRFTGAKGQESSNSESRASERQGTQDRVTGTVEVSPCDRVSPTLKRVRK